MHNRIGFNRLDRKASHRKALHRNMVTSLIKYERITTTKAKAKEIRRTAEKLVTRAKVDSVHNRRIAAKFLFEEAVLHKLFTKVGPRFVKRPGGYTRIFKIGRRSGDAAEMVILEFLKEDEPLIFKKKSSKKGKDFGETGKKAQQGSTADNRQSEQNTDKTTGEPVGEAQENKPEDPLTHGSEMPEADERPTEEASGAEADDDAGKKFR